MTPTFPKGHPVSEQIIEIEVQCKDCGRWYTPKHVQVGLNWSGVVDFKDRSACPLCEEERHLRDRLKRLEEMQPKSDA